MSSSAANAEAFVKAISAAGDVSAKKMFGEFGIFCDGKMVALVCDDQFFVRTGPEALEYWGEGEMGIPYPSAKPCLQLSEWDLGHKARLTELIRIAWDELPTPKPKKPKASTRSKPAQ